MARNGKYVNAEGSMSKLKAGRSAVWVTEQAIQILGGYGYTREYPVERWHRDAKIFDIFEGTEQIQQLVISPGDLRPAHRVADLRFLRHRPVPATVGGRSQRVTSVPSVVSVRHRVREGQEAIVSDDRRTITVTLPADVQQFDQTDFVWAFLDAAPEPDQGDTRALIVAGDAEEPFLARVVDIVRGAQRSVDRPPRHGGQPRTGHRRTAPHALPSDR